MGMQKSKKMVQKILSGFMVFAVALSMCIVFVPQKVLAAGSIYIMRDGSKLAETTDWDNILLVIDNINDADSVSYDLSNKTLTMNGTNANYLSGEVNNYIIEGTCSISTIYYPGTISVTIKGSDSSLLVSKIHMDSTGDDYTLSQAVDAKMLNITDGKIDGDTIVADSGDSSGSENSGDSGNTKALKVNDLVTEKGKTAANSATYKITSVKAKNRTVTLVKPAKNAKGTVTIKDEITLSDNNKYKVTAIADNAFSKFAGKKKITAFVIGKNVNKIGKNACADCINVKKVTVKSAGLSKKTSVGNNAFKNVKKNVKINVKLSKADSKNKAKVISTFKQKKIGYVKTWTVK